LLQGLLSCQLCGYALYRSPDTHHPPSAYLRDQVGDVLCEVLTKELARIRAGMALPPRVKDRDGDLSFGLILSDLAGKYRANMRLC
jgi:hypothetical protein